MTWNVRGYPESTAAKREWFRGQLLALAPDIPVDQKIANQEKAEDLAKRYIIYFSDKFKKWLVSNGLSEVFEFESAVFDEEVLVVTIGVSHLEEVIEDNDVVLNYYVRLYSKVVAITEIPPTNVRLDIKLRRGGYCDPSVIVKKIGIFKNRSSIDRQLQISEEVIEWPKGWMCSLDFEYITEYKQSTINAINNTKQIASAAQPIDKLFSTQYIKNYLETRYLQIGGDVKITSISENVITAVIRNIRGEVVSDKKYWEKLEVFAILFKQGRKLQFHMVLDGQYAAGLTMPPDQAYIDMEPEYTKNLLEYGNIIILELKEKKK